MERIAEVTLTGVRLNARWDVFDAATITMIVDRLMVLQNLYAEAQEKNAALRAKLDAVPVADIRKVCHAAEMDGYTNDAVDEWLGELEQAAQD